MLTLLSFLAFSAAHAAPPTPPPPDKPTFLYQEGTAHYRRGLFRQAIEEFLEADRLRSSPVLAYDTAQTYERLGEPEHAAEYYRIYLQRLPGAADRPVIEATLRSLESWIEARRAANQDPGAEFRQIGLYLLASSCGIGALGFGSYAIGDGEPRSNQSAANAFHVTGDVLFVSAGVGLLSAGLFFLLGTTGYATAATAVAMRGAPGGFALAW